MPLIEIMEILTKFAEEMLVVGINRGQKKLYRVRTEDLLNNIETL